MTRLALSRLVLRTCITAALLASAVRGQPAAIKLDLGPEKAAVMEGFQALTAKSVYSPDRGYGWQPYALGDWKSPAVDHQKPDALWADFLMVSRGKTRLRIDLSDGEYHLWFWTGQWGSHPWGLPSIQGFGLRSADGGGVIHETTLEQFLDESFGWPLRRWFEPGADFYRDWIGASFRRFDGSVVAKDGRLMLSFFGRFALNALVVCPEADRAETERWLADLGEKQRAAFVCENVTPAVPDDFSPTDEEKRRGLVLFTPQKETLVFPTSTPNDTALQAARVPRRTTRR